MGGPKEVLRPFHAIAHERAQSLLLHLTIGRPGFNDGVAGHGPERVVLQPLPDVGGELAVVGALLNKGEIGGAAQGFPGFLRHLGEQAAIERPHADGGEEVAAPPDSSRRAAIVAVLGVVQGQLHDLGKTDPLAG